MSALERSIDEKLLQLSDEYRNSKQSALSYANDMITVIRESYDFKFEELDNRIQGRIKSLLSPNRYTQQETVVIAKDIIKGIRQVYKEKQQPKQLKKMVEEMKQVGELEKKEEKEKVRPIANNNEAAKDTFTFLLIQDSTRYKHEVKLPSHIAKKDKQAVINSLCDSLAWNTAKKIHRCKKLKLDYFKANKPLEIVLTYQDNVILSTTDLHSNAQAEAEELGLERTQENAFAIKIGSLKDKKGVLKFGSKMKALCQEFENEFKIIEGQVETDDFESMF